MARMCILHSGRELVRAIAEKNAADNNGSELIRLDGACVPVPATMFDYGFTRLGAVDLTTLSDEFGKTAYAEVTNRTKDINPFGPYNELFEDFTDYEVYEDEGRVMGHVQHFRDGEQHKLPKYKEIRAVLSIKQKCDRYVSQMNQQDLIILLSEGGYEEPS